MLERSLNLHERSPNIVSRSHDCFLLRTEILGSGKGPGEKRKKIPKRKIAGSIVCCTRICARHLAVRHIYQKNMRQTAYCTNTSMP